MRIRAVGAVTLLVLAFSLVHCTEPATEVIVHIDTDLPRIVPFEIHITARRGDAPIPVGTPPDRVWPRASASANHDASLDAGILLPATFAIVPPPPGPNSTDVTLRVEGFTPNDVLRRTVRFPFTGHQTRHITVFLASHCLDPDTLCTHTTPCTVQAFCEEQGQTCGDLGACVSIDQNPTLDAASQDAGCVPYCQGAVCGGPDGCGGRCQTGSCGSDQTCRAGQCVCASGFTACAGTCMPSSMVQCQPGDRRSQGCGNCGTQSATCGNNCQWSGWSACGSEGCAPGSTRPGGCDPCSHETCTASCTWGGCTLNAGAQCEYQGGNHHRSCGACACGQQYCLSSCVWSTACVSFCGGFNSGGCFASCSGGC